MKIHYFPDYDSFSQAAKELMLQEIIAKYNLLISAATGNSPLKAYQLLASDFAQNPDLFAQLRIIKPDEWGGVPMEHPQTCESFIREHIIEPWRISEDRYFSFESNPSDPEEVCRQMQDTLTQQGPIDLCILGIGKNGHICFNEPAETLTYHFHKAILSPESLTHSMAQSMEGQLQYGLTLGVGDIFKSQKILLLITGSGKKAACEALLSQKISTQLPASLLWLHPNVDCLIDRQVL